MNVNKIFIGLLIAAFVVACGVGLFYATNDNGKLGENIVGGNVTNSYATTSTSLPVKVLDNDMTRSYARITNGTSTSLYLHLGYFSSANAASSTVLQNQGIELEGGESWEITSENLYLGQVWVATSSGGSSDKLFYVEE